jgi:hypothetical protein
MVGGGLEGWWLRCLRCPASVVFSFSRLRTPVRHNIRSASELTPVSGHFMLSRTYGKTNPQNGGRMALMAQGLGDYFADKKEKTTFETGS